MLKATNINKSFKQLQVLKDITLSVEKGEVVSIVGKSGAGKSTLLHILGTLDKIDNGTLEINNQNISLLDEKQLASFRNQHIGFIFQFHHLLPEFTALENVCIPALIKKTNKKEAKQKAMELLGFLGLKGRIMHKPSQLSGGEQQRVAVARALINQPSIIMADEPSGNLDSNTSKQLHKLFLDLRKEMNQTFVIVTHNTELAQMSDRTITLKDGRVHNKK